MKKNRKPGSKSVAPVLRIALIGVATYLIVVVLLLLGMTPEQYDIKVGFPAYIDILATKDVTDTVTTEANRKRAAEQVEESYKSVDDSVLGTVTAALNDSFDRLLDLRTEADAGAEITDEALDRLNAELPVAISREQYAALLSADVDTLQALFSEATNGARDALITTLPEGREEASVSRISRTLTSSGYSPELVSLAAEVLRTCIQPNMLIDVEITEANRQKAMDAVEPKTFLRGEAIVRRGERVTEAQYQMLSTLGLLKEDNLDLQMMGGVALLLFLIMGATALYLYCFERKHLNPKTLTLVALICVLVLALSLAFSRLNAFLVPASLGIMLLSLLVGRRLALFMNLSLGVLISLLNTSSMLSFVVMCLVSGPIILWVYGRRSQRTTTLLAGVLVGLSNFLVTLSVGLINSSEMRVVLTNAVWSMGSGLLSAILCIGIQPVLELVFNVATNAKLIELSNPNQPLLRRLLLEAPGTYHHAIIVANLAEAAADAIGANGLLARVGAYYHDVGKLKRPGYFTENQVGDNPHDRTDPRVSSAILTAHPRDGYQLAQKVRIPQPVLDIIQQHHGDGVTLYFYDKAVKQYGADQVDINAFRYEGPRPRSKEAAAVMLADTIEAATRSIPNPTPEKIDAMIRKLVRGKLDDGQLDESELTFKDLEMVCSAFSTVLTGVFHERIEYPDIALPPRAEQPADASPAPETQRPVPTPPDSAKPANPEPVKCASKAGTPCPPAAKPAEAATTPERASAPEPSVPPKSGTPCPPAPAAKPAEAAASPERASAPEPSAPPKAGTPCPPAAKPAETATTPERASAPEPSAPPKSGTPCPPAAKPAEAATTPERASAPEPSAPPKSGTPCPPAAKPAETPAQASPRSDEASPKGSAPTTPDASKEAESLGH